jgi:hypothetical protein
VSITLCAHSNMPSRNEATGHQKKLSFGRWVLQHFVSGASGLQRSALGADYSTMLQHRMPLLYFVVSFSGCGAFAFVAGLLRSCSTSYCPANPSSAATARSQLYHSYYAWLPGTQFKRSLRLNTLMNSDRLV